MYEHTAIGYRIVDARKYLGLTKEQVGKYLGIDIACLTEWETGYSKPPDEALAQLTHLLKVSPTFFLEGPSEEDRAKEGEIINGIARDLPMEDRLHVARFIQFLHYAGRAPKKEEATE